MANFQAPVQTPKSYGPLLLYWGGKVTSDNDVGYDGGVTKLLKIPSSIPYSGLLSKIHQVTKYSQDEYKLKLICRWPTDRCTYALVNIIDNESVAFMLGLFNKIFTIELFVEADRVLRGPPVSNLIGGHASYTGASLSSSNFIPQPTQTSSNLHGYQQMHPPYVQAHMQHAPHGDISNPPQQSKNSYEHNHSNAASNIEELSKEEDTSDDDNAVDSFDKPPLVVARPGKSIWLNATFSSKEIMLQELQRWSLARHVQYTYDHSKADDYSLYCVHGNCKWSVCACQKPDSRGRLQWYISSYGEEHSCTNPLRLENHRQCSSSFICDYILPVFKANFTMHVGEVMELVKSEFCIDIPYSKAYHARKKALKCVDGNESCLPPTR